MKKKRSEKEIWKALETVSDPEIPFLSVVDLGIITRVEVKDHKAYIEMTPTFAACPAIAMIRSNIKKEIEEALEGTEVEVDVNYDIQWNSNMVTDKGRKILKEFGLAPPPVIKGEMDPEKLESPPCPYCDGTNTEPRSTFGSTLCRSIYYCEDCNQTFEQFKAVG